MLSLAVLASYIQTILLDDIRLKYSFIEITFKINELTPNLLIKTLYTVIIFQISSYKTFFHVRGYIKTKLFLSKGMCTL